jgi:branched-chain amino acid transport system permease protein
MLDSAVSFTYLALSFASVYILVAIGFSIAFGSLRFVNLAHGALYLLGAYIGLFVAFEMEVGGVAGAWSPIGFAWGFAAALVLTPIALFVIGIVMERFIAKPMYDRSLVDQLLVTFGILIIVQEAIAVLFGRQGYTYARPDWASGAIALPGLGSLNRWRVYVIVLTALVILLLYAFYKFTDVGLAVRAGTEDSEMVELLGIRVGRPFMLVFAIGAAYAGLGGILAGPIFTVNPEIGITQVLIPSLLVVIVGGVGSITGTVVAGVLFGAVFVAVSWVLTGTWAMIGIYTLAVVVLMVKPTGLFGPEEVTV